MLRFLRNMVCMGALLRGIALYRDALIAAGLDFDAGAFGGMGISGETRVVSRL